MVKQELREELSSFNLVAKKIKDRVHTTLKIINAHNNDYTSTYTQSDRERLV
jgi:hypothetical protein